MSFFESSTLGSLIRSSSHESKKKTLSISHSKTKEFCPQAAKEKLAKNFPKELKKLKNKNRVVLRETPDLLMNNRRLSENKQYQSVEETQLRQKMNIFENFQKKIENSQSIENHVDLLLGFLEDISVLNSFFSNIFLKISEIVKAYQQYVKSLDSTRSDNQDLALEIKNSIFREVPSKVIKYKPQANKKLFEEPLIKLIPETPVETCSKVQKISIIKPNLQLKLQSRKKDKRSTSMKIPKLSIDFSEKLDFHEEFMQKYDEFSLSWREQAMKLKK